MDNSTNGAAQTKPFWASKTFWTNIVAIVAAVTGALSVDVGLTPEAQIAVVTAIMGVVNIVLRVITRQPIHVKKP